MQAPPHGPGAVTHLHKGAAPGRATHPGRGVAAARGAWRRAAVWAAGPRIAAGGPLRRPAEGGGRVLGSLERGKVLSASTRLFRARGKQPSGFVWWVPQRVQRHACYAARSRRDSRAGALAAPPCVKYGGCVVGAPAAAQLFAGAQARAHGVGSSAQRGAPVRRRVQCGACAAPRQQTMRHGGSSLASELGCTGGRRSRARE